MKKRDWTEIDIVELGLIIDGMQSDIQALNDAVEVLQAQEKKLRKHHPLRDE